MYRKAFFNKKYLVYVWSKESAYLTTMNEKKFKKIMKNESVFTSKLFNIFGVKDTRDWVKLVW